MRRVQSDIDFVWGCRLSSTVDRAWFVLVIDALYIGDNDLPLHRPGHRGCEPQIGLDVRLFVSSRA